MHRVSRPGRLSDSLLEGIVQAQIEGGGEVDQLLIFELDRRDRYRPPAPQETASRSLLGAALWYAGQGLSVLPLRPGLKTPASRHGVKDATTDAQQIRAWWTKNPTANIGIATGGLIDVCDLDSAEAADLWFTQVGDLPPLAGLVQTPRGWHYWTPATGRGNAVNRDTHTDWRGVGGYVVAPPSRIESGVYWWRIPPKLPSC